MSAWSPVPLSVGTLLFLEHSAAGVIWTGLVDFELEMG